MLEVPKYLLRLYRSNKYIYAQVLSPHTQNIVISASSIEPNLRTSLPKTCSIEVRTMFSWLSAATFTRACLSGPQCRLALRWASS